MSMSMSVTQNEHEYEYEHEYNTSVACLGSWFCPQAVTMARTLAIAINVQVRIIFNLKKGPERSTGDGQEGDFVLNSKANAKNKNCLLWALTITQRLTMVKPFKPTSSKVRNPKTCVGMSKLFGGPRFFVSFSTWRAAVSWAELTRIMRAL